MKRFHILLAIVLGSTACTAKMIVIRLVQESETTKYAFSDKYVSKDDVARVLNKLASIDNRQFIIVSTQTNVPASELTGMIGLIQRTGLHNLALICQGTDGTNSGTWNVTIDAIKKSIPTCIQGVESESGFQIENRPDPAKIEKID